MKRLACLILLCILLVFACTAQAEIIQVSPQGITLSQALLQSTDGDIIELADGIYAEPAEEFPLIVDKAVIIRAAEGTQPVIDAPKFKAALRVEADGVVLSGLDIRMRRTGIYAIGDDMTVEDCTITLADTAWRTSSCAVWMGGIYRAVFRDCAFIGCSVSIAGPPLSESSKGLPVLTGLFEVGEDPAYFTTHAFENCTVNGKPVFYAASQPYVDVPTGAGQIICVDCDSVQINGAEIADASMGMILAYDDQVHIEKSNVARCGVFGIYVAKCGEGLIEDCVVSETNHGIDVRAVNNMILSRCTAVDCDQGLFFSMVHDSVMRDCLVEGTGQGYFMAAGSGNLIENCAAIACENGYNLQKENDVTMRLSSAEACTVCGVRLDWSPTVFERNELLNNWVGVLAYGEVGYLLKENTFDGNQSCGLYLRDISKSEFRANCFISSGEKSVDAVGSMSESLWAENVLDKDMTAQESAVFIWK